MKVSNLFGIDHVLWPAALAVCLIFTGCANNAYQIKQRIAQKPSIAVVYVGGEFRSRSYYNPRDEVRLGQKIPAGFEAVVVPEVVASLKEGFELSDVSAVKPPMVTHQLLGQTVQVPNMRSVKSDVLAIITMVGEYNHYGEDQYRLTISAHMLLRENPSQDTIGSLLGYSVGEVSAEAGSKAELPSPESLIPEMKASAQNQAAQFISEIKAAQP